MLEASLMGNFRQDRSTTIRRQLLHAAAATLLLLDADGGARAQGLPDAMPDLSQGDPAFAGRGDQYCAPVAVSNSLWWLSHNGFPKLAAGTQVQLAQGLAQQMGTDSDGTSPAELMAGLQKYLRMTGCSGTILHRGWRQPTPSNVDQQFLVSALGPSQVCWINLGWYNQNGTLYRRGGGHWVTLVGATSGATGTVLQLHDPSERTGSSKRTETVVLEKLSSGELVGKNKGLPRSAAGMYKVRSGLALPSRYDTAIIDGAVTLRL